MKQLHWSFLYANFITLEIPYDDGARQGWDYDCSQYESLETLKANMAADFAEPRMDRTTMMIHVFRNGETFAADVDLPTSTGTQFVDFVFDVIDGIINGD